MEVPDSVIEIFKEFRDMVHLKFPEELPPRQHIAFGVPYL